jgi:glycosyltransferase involved in cell wall biosynthesis
MSISKTQEMVRSFNEKPVIDTGVMNRIPFFSVCIPTYNRAFSLPTAIESVLAQDFTDFELVICDNASNDNTEEVVKNYRDERIRYVRYKNLVNMWANHNRCIELAQAEWLIFLHSDDNFEKNALDLIKSELIKVQDVEILAPKFDYLEPFREIIQSNDNQFFLNKEASFLMCTMSFSPSGVCFKKKSFSKRGNFLETELNINGSSYCFWSDGVLEKEWLLQGAKIYMSKQRWFVYNQGNQSAYSKMQGTLAFYKANFPVMHSFFSFQYKHNNNKLENVLDNMVQFFSKTPDELKVSFLKRCYQAGYIKEGNYIDKSLATFGTSYRRLQDYVCHVIPLKLSPSLYWFLLSLKKSY